MRMRYRTQMVSFAATPEEERFLNALSAEKRVTRSELIRSALWESLGSPVPAPKKSRRVVKRTK